MKLNKTPIASRPVGRVFNSQMKTYEQLIEDILTQVFDDIEDERVRQGKKRIVLNSTLSGVHTNTLLVNLRAQDVQTVFLIQMVL
jgi:hypothetical protein